jgi:hypothetical protein
MLGKPVKKEEICCFAKIDSVGSSGNTQLTWCVFVLGAGLAGI